MPQESSKAYKSYWLMRAGCRHIIGINFNWEMTQKKCYSLATRVRDSLFFSFGCPSLRISLFHLKNLVAFVAGWEQKYSVVRFIKTSGLLTNLYGNDLRSPSICQATLIIPSN